VRAVKTVNPNVDAKYPYSRNRVVLSVVIAALSTILALSLLLSDTVLVLYYSFLTAIFAAITFFLKKRLYVLLLAEEPDENEDDSKRTSWKILLITFLMLVGSIGLPLLSAGLFSGSIWFTIITSFMTGVSVSEILIYFQAKKRELTT
jgi:hypothetical protein